MDDASLELNHEQHVVAAEQHGVDVEEVGGHDALGLSREELAPGWALSSRGRFETVTAQDRSDSRLRHRYAELSHDPEIAPTRVLTRQAADELHGLFGKRRTTWSAVWVGPALADQRAVPAEDCLRREERSPALSGY